MLLKKTFLKIYEGKRKFQKEERKYNVSTQTLKAQYSTVQVVENQDLLLSSLTTCLIGSL